MTDAGSSRDYAREIADAMKAGDVGTLGALAIELHGRVAEARTTLAAMQAAEAEVEAAEQARREKNAERQRRFRESHPQPSRKVTPRNVTERDVTGGHVAPPNGPPSPVPGPLNPNPPLTPLPAVANANGGAPRKPRPVAKWPNFPESDCFTLHRAWEDIVGGVDYPRFRRALGPLFRRPTPDYSLADIIAGIKAGHDDAQQRFESGEDYALRQYTPEAFVGQARHWTSYAKQPTQDAEGNLTPKGRRLAGIR